MVLGYIGVFFGRLLQAAVSRHRERLADASAVQFTRNPGGLSGALLKIAGVSSGSRAAGAGSRGSRAHAVCRRPAAHVRDASVARRAAQGARPGVSRQRTADAGRRGGARRACACARPTPRSPARPRRPAAAAGAFPVGAAPRATLASDAAVIAAQAGTIATEQVRYAERARASIPGRRARIRRLRRPRARAHPGLAGEQGAGGARRAAARARGGLGRRVQRARARTARHRRCARAGAAPAGRAAAVSRRCAGCRWANARSCATWSGGSRSPMHASMYSSAA